MNGPSQVYRIVEMKKALMREQPASPEVLRGMLIVALDILGQQQAQLEVMRAVSETLNEFRGDSKTIVEAAR